MHKRFVSPILVLLSLMLCAPQLYAQCMGCSSSTSCGTSSQRGGCKIECIGTSCICADEGCRPRPTRNFEAIQAEPGLNVFALRNDQTVRFTSGCRDRWIGVSFGARRAEAVRASLTTVWLRKSAYNVARRSPSRIAKVSGASPSVGGG